MIRVTRSAVIDAPLARVWEVLRDFNSHWAWHPAVGESVIENGEAPDQVGCVRSFYLKDGNHIREQLLGLSDEDYFSTYCILDATLPMRRYVATVKLKPVTDGERTFWHWQSTFDVPRGREQEFADLVGKGVYEGGFEGLRAYLRRGGPQTGAVAPGSTATRVTPAGATAAAQSSATAGDIAAHAVVARAFGDADVLEYRSVQAPAPGSGQVRIRQSAVGVNYIDVYVRAGLYPMIDPPAAIGMEAAGTVIDVGSGVAHLLPGDRVAYACAPPGAYASVRTMAADQVVVLPDDVSDEQAAALMLKGMTAEYLLHRTHRVQRGQTVLVHAAAGGAGLLLCQWAKALGARVIGTVSTDDKARVARANGCDFPLVTADYQFAAAVKNLTQGRGADVIYDGLGRGAAAENFEALAFTGHWVSYGQASGAHDAPPDLSAKSGTLSRPVLFHYTADRAVLKDMAERTFAALREGIIKAEIRHRYPLTATAQAHRDLEGRRTTGSVVLIP